MSVSGSERPDGGSATGIEAQNLEALLRTRVRGEVRFKDGDRALYSTDASNYRQIPIGVVLPRDAEDVEAAIACCRTFGVPVVARGGGTSLAGQACNVAVVIDMSKYMNRVLQVDWNGKWARVQPGVVLDDLRNAAEERHLTFGPDPATHNRNTLGGMIGNNSCGMHAQMAGKVEENTEQLEILTYDGLRMRVGTTSDEECAAIVASGGRRGEIYARLRELRDRYAELIRERFPAIPRRVSGYPLDELLPENGFNVARALVGTEGTCVTVLEAKLRLVHSPPGRVLVILGFEDIATAAGDVAFCNAQGPIALEAMDGSVFRYMREKRMSSQGPDIFPDGDAWLIAEFGATTKAQARVKAEALIAAYGTRPRAPTSKILDSQEEEHALWEIRDAVLGATSKIPGEPDFYPGWEDSAVAPERMGEYLREFQSLMREYGYTGAL